MSYLSEVQAAASEAERVLANITGGEGVIIGGQTVHCTISAANAFQLEALGYEMTEHGYRNQSLFIFTATRTQFASDPRTARQTKLIRPSDPGDYTIHSVHAEDPLHYVFIVIKR